MTSADSRSSVEVLIDTATKIAIEMLHDDPHVRRGLQGIIPGHCNLVLIMTQHSNGKKVSMLVVQARNELKGQGKGQRKRPPELQSHTPPTSGFISNVGNSAYCNRLSNELMNPHHETRQVKSPTNVPLATMMERVQKRMLYKCLDQSTTPVTKRVAGRAHMQIACNDAVFTSVIDLLQKCPVFSGEIEHLLGIATCNGLDHFIF
jgi:hypothetical protein